MCASSLFSSPEHLKGNGGIDAKAVERCRLRGIKMIRAVVHLEQLGGTGIFETYPETRGKGKFPDWASVFMIAWCTALAHHSRARTGQRSARLRSRACMSIACC
jgi:hypothetical protein